jgi:hypothetical protein
MTIKLACSIVLSFAIVSVACACNIPVFRYALERWQPDQCEVVVFHKGGLTGEQQQLLKQLGEGDSGQGQHANVKIIESDVSLPTQPHAALWAGIESETHATLPYVVLRTKLGFGKVVNGWHGPLDAVGRSGVLDSPARRELGRRLLAGHSIVWLVIGSDDKQQNMAARQMLAQNFESLAGKIELPEGVGLPGSELHSEVPLLLEYSLLEIDRKDVREQFLVELLSGFQPEAVAQGEPLIVPVFGRGRALEVIPANDLSDHLMKDLTVFLSGACSCQVKEQNPGFDLLLSVDWNRELFGEGAEPPPEKTTRDRQRPTLLTIPPGR